jgi:hypothetical protein
MEDRISGFEDKIDIKDKPEEYIEKRLKSCERNMQEHCDSIKRQNLQIWALKEKRCKPKET